MAGKVNVVVPLDNSSPNMIEKTRSLTRETPKSNPDLLKRRRAVEDILERKREKELYGDVADEF